MANDQDAPERVATETCDEWYERYNAHQRALVPPDTLAARTRRHLLAAGIVREALHVSTVATVRANFRSWRDSGLTWLAMIGVDAARIMRRAGHDDVATTMRYVKQAEDLGDALGEPFGALPPELTS